VIDSIFGTELRRAVEESFNDRSVLPISDVSNKSPGLSCIFFPADNYVECGNPFAEYLKPAAEISFSCETVRCIDRSLI